LWAITGAGYKIRSVFETMLKLKSELNIKITIVLSRAGYEVSRLYGVLGKLKLLSSGEYYEEIFVENPIKPISRLPGRVMLGKYELLIMAPTTANTIAKIVNGIADTLVTQVYAMAEKSKTKVIIMPSDISEKTITELPCIIDHAIRRA